MGGTIPLLKCGRNIFSQLEEFGLLAQIEEEVSLMRLWCPAVNDNGIGLVVSFERTTRVTVLVCRLVVLELIATCDEAARLIYETSGSGDDHSNLNVLPNRCVGYKTRLQSQCEVGA